MPISLKGAERRKARVRKSIKARAYGRPRLSVHRSDKNIYAQIIDDAQGVTLVSASSLESGEGAPDNLDRAGTSNGSLVRKARRQVSPPRPCGSAVSIRRRSGAYAAKCRRISAQARGASQAKWAIGSGRRFEEALICRS